MATTTSKLEICINKDITNIIRAKQMDSNSRFLEITLMEENGTPYDLTGHTARFNARKSDGKFVFNDCVMTDPANGIITVELTDQTLAIGDSKVVADIGVYNADGKEVLTTRTFEIMVQTTMRDDSAIESSDEYGAVVTLFQDVWDIRTRIVRIDELLGNLGDDVPEGGTQASTDSLMGALNKTYNMMLSQGFIGLNLVIYAQTVLQNINTDSVAWAFEIANRQGKLGMLIDIILNLGNVELQALTTWAEVLGNTDALAYVIGAEAAMTALAASESGMNALAANAKALNAVCKSVYASYFTESNYNTAVFEMSLQTCIDNSNYFTLAPVAAINNNTNPTDYAHNISSNTWSSTIPSQNAIYFTRRIDRYGVTATGTCFSSYDYDGTQSTLVVRGSSTATVATLRMCIGTIAINHGNAGDFATTLSAAITNVNGAAFIPV